jgi:hypothetical protein
MNEQHALSTEQQREPANEETALEAFAAELTDAAYPIALKYGVSGSSVDLELEIWKKFTEMVHERGSSVLGASAKSEVAAEGR